MADQHQAKTPGNKKQESAIKADEFVQEQAEVPVFTPQRSINVMQLQRTVGNKATIQLLRPGNISVSSTGTATIQRWPKWLDKLLGKSEESQPLLSDEDREDGAESESYINLQKVKAKLQDWANTYAIHTNYQKYAQYLGNTAWKKVMQVWEYVNKVLGLISKVDPSGVTQAISAISSAMKMLAKYITEAYELVTDIDLIEQLTPLLDVNILEKLKESVEELKDIWDTGKDAWDAVITLV